MTDNETSKPVEIAASGQLIGAGALIGRAELTVVPADRIEVEDASSLKYLGLRSGYIQVPNHVFVVMEGSRHEITVDSLPDEQQGA